MSLKRGDKGSIRVCLHCEAPRLGSGWRQIEFKIGNRHARLKNPHTGRTAKIARAAFEQIVAASKDGPKTIIDKTTGKPVTKETVAQRFVRRSLA